MEQKRQINKENTFAILALFWNFAKKYPRDLRRVLTFVPLYITLLFTLVPWFISKLVEQLSLPVAQQNLAPYILGIIICALLGILCNYIGLKAHFRHNIDSYAAVERTCFDALTKRGEHFYANQFTGALTKYSIDFPNSYSAIEVITVNNVIPLLVRTLTGVVIVIIGGAPLLAAILFLLTFSTLFLLWRTRAVRQAIRIQRRDAQTKINGHLADVITNNQTMRTFAQWERESNTNKTLVEKWHHLISLDFMRLNTLFNRVLQINLFLQISFVILLVVLVRSGSVSVAVAIFSVTYLTRFATEMLAVGGIMNQTENALIDAVPMMRILEEGPEVTDVKHAQKLSVTKGEIRFDDVTFAYSDNAEQTVLPNLNLVIKPGEKIGLVGPSGGGKTTLTKLLLRLLDIQGGQILIDGQDISQVTQASLRQTIAYVPQEPLLFHRSLAENISYASNKATMQQIKKVARQAHADDFIQNLPQQYDTMVGERGVKLSGGQRQRVAIARAILKDAPILVLDEATSALDSESEKLIQDALTRLMEGRTTIVIAHRLSTIQKMDRIIVLDEGRIVEEGSHKQLLKQSGTYAKLWAHQSGGYLED